MKVYLYEDIGGVYIIAANGPEEAARVLSGFDRDGYLSSAPVAQRMREIRNCISSSPRPEVLHPRF